MSQNILLSKVDMKENGGKGKVIFKRQEILLDTVEDLKITATRHANGRDWWLVFREYQTSKFYTFLINPDGSKLQFQQDVGPQQLKPSGGQAAFSPDGKHYAQFGSLLNPGKTSLELFDFDRCSGLLSNPRKTEFMKANGNEGAAFSPDSRYLYFSKRERLYQIKTEDTQIDTQAVALWDGFKYDIGGFNVYTWFGLMAPGPDGRIYNITPFVSSNYIHCINHPNRAGAACDVRQHAIKNPSFYFNSMPNVPYYRLGPVDGSICDSLGIDNLPFCWWRYEPDTSSYLKIEFTDVSSYEPKTWFWDFGDGTFSSDTNPVHTFPGKGVYEVCLIVSNENGADTLCRTIYLSSVSTNQPEFQDWSVTVNPNPFYDDFNVILSGYVPQNGRFSLFNQTGQLVKSLKIYSGMNQVDLLELPNGIYFFKIEDAGKMIGQGKVVKLERP